MSNQSLGEFARFANELADLSGGIIRNVKQSDRRPVIKVDSSPVTDTDRTVEKCLRERIVDRFPHHGILGEELGSERLDQEFIWVIDPIDGTKAFIAGLAVYGTLISLTQGGVPVIGLIDNPSTRDRWLGVSGQITTLNNRAVKSSATTELAAAFMSQGTPDSFVGTDRDKLKGLREATRWCVYGGSCTTYGRIADGSVDICIDGGLEPYDYCALVPVVTGAGGLISDWNGSPLGLFSGDRCVATSNKQLHDQVLEQLV